MTSIKQIGTSITGLIGLLSLLAMPLATQAGVATIAKQCDSCHGKNGNSSDPVVPSIAGFSAITIEEIMPQYKSGDRPADKYTPEGGEESDMKMVSDKLANTDLVSIAAHYASQTYEPMKQDFDTALAEKGKKIHDKKCEKCHSEGGTLAEDDAAILAGQGRQYLTEQFRKIMTDERPVPKKMKKKFKKVNEDDANALIEFYISKQ